MHVIRKCCLSSNDIDCILGNVNNLPLITQQLADVLILTEIRKVVDDHEKDRLLNRFPILLMKGIGQIVFPALDCIR